MPLTEEFIVQFNETSHVNSYVQFEQCDDESWMLYVPYLYAQYYDAVHQPWIMSVMASILVGFSGIVPLLVIPIDDTATLKNGTGAKTLRLLLSFAVGGLLGDVFLHLLPEAWGSPHSYTDLAENQHARLTCGLWVLTGLLAFIIIEKMFSHDKEDEEGEVVEGDAIHARGMTTTTNKTVPIRRKKNSFILNDLTVNYKITEASVLAHEIDTTTLSGQHRIHNNNAGDDKLSQLTKKPSNIHVSGYLNLMANSIDNFTHGLAVGGSFMLSTRVGFFTTFAILVHEIPHEVGDFAILLRAGFTRWDAACAQLYTAFAGILGSITALLFSVNSSATEARTSWILPFTAGGFLHIALVTVLPELLTEKNPKESLKQVCSLVSGITIMALLTALIEG